MRLIPKTMFVRLAVALSLILILAQLVSMGIHFRDRGQFLYHNLGIASIQRIAGVVKLMDSLAPEQRLDAIRALNSPGLRIKFVDGPVTQMQPDNPLYRPMQVFRKRLQRNLGTERKIRIDVRPEQRNPPYREASPRGRPGGNGNHERRNSRMPHRMEGMMGRLPRPGPAFLVQVELRSGNWLSFDQHLPAGLFEWPRKLFTSLIVLLVIAIFASWFIVRHLTKPLDNLSKAAESLGRDLRQPPLPETGSSEVRKAAAAFNQMQVRIRRFIDDRSNMLGAVSHDLKTPLTRLRLRTELLEDAKIQQKFEQDLSEMEVMIDSALDFMRGIDTEEPLQQTDIEALLESLQSDAQEMGKEIGLSGSSTAPYPCRPLALKRCLSNLINNALKYAGSATIRIEDSKTQLKIAIEDNGPGIPEHQLERVFDAFYRLEKSRNKETGGNGLGLGIARNVARSHGGDLLLSNRANTGLCAQLILPR